MSHLWGLDAAQCPNDAELARLISVGWAFFGLYHGGHTPGKGDQGTVASHISPKEDYARLNAAGFKIVSYFVGPLDPDPGPSYEDGVSDGNASLAAMQARGLSGWCHLDIENGLAPREWTRGFVDANHAGQCKVRLYGSHSSIVALGDLVDSWYLAFYAEAMMSLRIWEENIIDWDIWQVDDGTPYDINCARDDIEFTGFTA